MAETRNRIDPGSKHLEWVALSKMKISPRTQRGHNTPSSKAKIENIAAYFDPDKAGNLTVNLREGFYWIIDGGHRWHAYQVMGWGDQLVQCWVYKGLNEQQEADMFLGHNDVKAVAGMDRFQRALVAKRETECDIDRIVRAQDLSVGNGKESIHCVGALTKAYGHGPRVLATTVRALRDSFGVRGFNSKVVEGTGLFVANYENELQEDRLIEKLSRVQGGANGLLTDAEVIKKKFGVPLGVSVAAAMVEKYNQGLRGPARLNGWWSTFTPSKSDDDKS